MAASATLSSVALGLLMLMLSGCSVARASTAWKAEPNAELRSSLVSSMASACGDAAMAERLIPCLPASRRNPAPPTRECCALIQSLSAECLCSCVQSPLAKLEGVDFGTALQLPHKCRRPVPPGTKCAGVSVPGWIP